MRASSVEQDFTCGSSVFNTQPLHSGQCPLHQPAPNGRLVFTWDGYVGLFRGRGERVVDVPLHSTTQAAAKPCKSTSLGQQHALIVCPFPELWFSVNSLSERGNDVTTQ